MVNIYVPSIDVNLRHRRLVGPLSYHFKLSADKSHSLYHIIPNYYQSNRVTRYSSMVNSRPFSLDRCRTKQFSRCLIQSTCRVWNTSFEIIVNSMDINAFKLLVNSFLLSKKSFFFKELLSCSPDS